MIIRRTKRFVTLLEVLIAMALTMIVVMTLTFFYSQVSMIESETDRLAAVNFKSRYLEARLASVIPNAVAKGDKEGDFFFTSFVDEGIGKAGSQSLLFTFDNGMSLDKELSNHVLGRIFLDKNGVLKLAYWPSPKRWKEGKPSTIKQEVLMENVESIAFEFYIPPAKKGEATTGKKNEPEPKGEWRKQPWPVEYNQLPAMTRLILEKQGVKKPIIYAYPMNNYSGHITYE